MFLIRDLTINSNIDGREFANVKALEKDLSKNLCFELLSMVDNTQLKINLKLCNESFFNKVGPLVERETFSLRSM